MKMPMMKCGHTAQGVNEKDQPVCVICFGIVPGATEVDIQPSLIGRIAVCACGNSEPSDTGLPFFQYLGEGSGEATNLCECGFYDTAHTKEGVARHVDPRTVIETGHCKGFRPKGANRTDQYYCGCRGWD